MPSQKRSSFVQRLTVCLMPVAAGVGAAVLLLLLAGGPARLAYAGTLTYPGCGATIQDCIDSANPGDTILIQAGDYTESLTLSKAVSLTGALSSTTLLHALPNTRVLTVTGAAVDSSVVISGLTFTGGRVTGTTTCPQSCGGGMLLANSAQPSLSSLRFISNTAGHGGGGLYAETDVVLTGVSFVGNAANSLGGGGMVAADGATLTEVSFVSNTATGTGGGLWASGTVAIIATQFVGNSSGDLGGGLYLWNATAGVTSTEFMRNTSGAGGGVALDGNLSGTQASFVNALLIGNRADTYGAAVFVRLAAGSAEILNTTIADPGLAPGAAVNVQTGTVSITDSIIASHTVGIALSSGSLVEDYNVFLGVGSYAAGSGGGHNLNGVPRFVNPGGDDYHLALGSVAVDAGAADGVATDFDGESRPQGLGFDSGCYESSFTALANVGVTKSTSAALVLPSQRLTYTLVFSNAGPFLAAGVRLMDLAPAYLTGLTYTSSGASLSLLGGQSYTWLVADLAPGTGGVVTVTGLLNDAPAGAVITNLAAISTPYSDTNPANNTSAVSVTVIVPPVAVDDVYSLPANGTLTVTAPGILANDSDANNFALSAVSVTGPTTGTLQLHADGSFTYAPPHNLVGVVSFTYQAYDGHAYSNIATVTLTVAQLKLYLPLVRR